nr:uncharacterized protein LOC111414659 [Onthophagus taurus]
MVVPTDRVSSYEKKSSSNKFVGNSQSVTISENVSVIKVIGNLCTINVFRNDGCIKIVGDGCKVSVQSGCGRINYVGNNGYIELGDHFDERNIQYVGNNGKIFQKVQGKLEEKSFCATKNSVSVNNVVNLNNQSSIHLGYSRKINVPYYEISIANLKIHKKR